MQEKEICYFSSELEVLIVCVDLPQREMSWGNKKMKTSLFLPFGQTLNDASEEVWATHFVNDLEVAKTLWRDKQ